MSRALLVLSNDAMKQRAIAWIRQAPWNTRIELKAPKRTLPQNDKLWASLTDVATQKDHSGRRYTTDQWKVIFMHACGREVQFLPSLDGSTFIPWGSSSSDLSKDEMSDLLEFILSWGAQNGVVFHEAREIAA